MKRLGKATTNKGGMKELKKNRSGLGFLIIAIIITMNGCSPFLTAQKKHYYKKGNSYCDMCIKEYTGSDTLQINPDLVCLFSNGKLKQLGKLKDGKKVGIWYFFSNYSEKKELDLIVRYKRNDSTWVWSKGMVNQSW